MTIAKMSPTMSPTLYQGPRRLRYCRRYRRRYRGRYRHRPRCCFRGHSR